MSRLRAIPDEFGALRKKSLDRVEPPRHRGRKGISFTTYLVVQGIRQWKATYLVSQEIIIFWPALRDESESQTSASLVRFSALSFFVLPEYSRGDSIQRISEFSLSSGNRGSRNALYFLLSNRRSTSVAYRVESTPQNPVCRFRKDIKCRKTGKKRRNCRTFILHLAFM